MQGERLDAGTVTPHGLLGDRAHALVDVSDGKVVSAKNPRKWPKMFEFSAAFVESPCVGELLPAVRITMPDGTSVESGQPDVDALLSGALGRAVRFQDPRPWQAEAAGQTAPSGWTAVAEEYRLDMEGLDPSDAVVDFDLPESSFVDCAAVHLLTTSTLARLAELYPAGRSDPRRFRPNVVVDTGVDEGFVEDAWVGATLHVGAEVQLRIDGPCHRCVMITLPQGELPKDVGILRTAALHNENHVGVYASVVRGGRVRRGDRTAIR